MANLQFSDSIVVARPAEELYDMVADVTRMGEWSPVCKECWWEGRRRRAARRVVVRRSQRPARPDVEDPLGGRGGGSGSRVTFIVGGSYVRWGYRFEPADGATVITESWEMLPDIHALFVERFGDGAAEQVADREEAAAHGDPGDPGRDQAGRGTRLSVTS